MAVNKDDGECPLNFRNPFLIWESEKMKIGKVDKTNASFITFSLCMQESKKKKKRIFKRSRYQEAGLIRRRLFSGRISRHEAWCCEKESEKHWLATVDIFPHWKKDKRVITHKRLEINWWNLTPYNGVSGGLSFSLSSILSHLLDTRDRFEKVKNWNQNQIKTGRKKRERKKRKKN